MQRHVDEGRSRFDINVTGFGEDAGRAGQEVEEGSMPEPTDPRAADNTGQDANPSTYGGMKDGLPASGAATHPEKTVDGNEGS